MRGELAAREDIAITGRAELRAEWQCSVSPQFRFKGQLLCVRRAETDEEARGNGDCFLFTLFAREGEDVLRA